MSLYTINGVSFEYDEMDLVNLELYRSELERLKNGAYGVDVDKVDDAAALSFIREQCEAVLDFFDCVVGEGTAERLFGPRRNIREILGAFNDFQSAVAKNLAALKDDMAPAPVNREQRRAAEREQRRKEAAARAAEKNRDG